MKCGIVEAQLHSFLTSGLDRGESASCPGCFTPSSHWIGGWVDPRVSLDAEAKRKISCPCWESNPSLSAYS
jgi:hypothetical protein